MQQKIVCYSLLRTLLNLPDKSKNNINACKDLEDLDIRRDLHSKRTGDGSLFYLYGYTMSCKERKNLCTVLK